MASLRDIRRRIKSVVSIKQITRAMEMVATTKLRRFQGRAQASRPFAAEIEKIVSRLAGAVPEGTSPLLQKSTDTKNSDTKKDGAIGIVVVTSDRGLCGAYNTNLLAFVHRYLRERGLETPGSDPKLLASKVKLYIFGKKGYTYFMKRGYDVKTYFAEPPLEKYRYQDVRIVAKQLVNDFTAGVVSEIQIISTRFESMVTFRPARAQWLPVAPPAAGKDANSKDLKANENSDAIIEPNAEHLLQKLVPKYLEMKLWNILLESLTSEYASRRVSMKNATDAADEMRGGLLRTYNKARQETITKQILEIVGGAEALK
ncbi:MAG: ATP synthase F1 subunit gamma [Planctomycetota bacterium]